MKNKFKKIRHLLQNEVDPAFKRRANIILAELDLSNNQRILDLGCGRGFYLKAINQLNPELKLTGLDINPEYLNAAKETIDSPRIKFIKGDATNLPFENNSFDQIIASEILEHIKEDERVIEEVYRVLKPGGKVIITVPNKNYPFLWDPVNWTLEKLFKTHVPSNIWWLAGIWADHQRLYTEENLKKKLEQSKFKINKLWKTTHYCLPFSHFVFYGVGKNLVEIGLCPNFNRFQTDNKQSLPTKTLLWPINTIDKLNTEKKYNSSVNIVTIVIKNDKNK